MSMQFVCALLGYLEAGWSPMWKHCCNKEVFQISYKNGMDYSGKKGEGRGGAVNIELTLYRAIKNGNS